MIADRSNYINIREIISRCTRHPMLKSLDLEQAISYVIDFIGIVGMPAFYEDKLVTIPIKEYRGVLPCDLISIIQVKESNTQVCMRSMTDSFNRGLKQSTQRVNQKPVDICTIRNKYPQAPGIDQDVIISDNKIDPTFKTQGRIIFTSFRTGEVKLSYRAIPVDDDGLPLLIDNSTFLKALELYIKKQVFTVLFDLGKLNMNILQNVQQEYAFAVAQCEKEFITPSISEMESISRLWNNLIPKTSLFKEGFQNPNNK